MAGADVLLTVGVARTASYQTIDTDLQAIQKHIEAKKLKINVGINTAVRTAWSKQIKSVLNGLNEKGFSVKVKEIDIGAGALSSFKRQLESVVNTIRLDKGVSLTLSAKNIGEIKKDFEDAGAAADDAARKIGAFKAQMEALGALKKEVQSALKSLGSGGTEEEQARIAEIIAQYNKWNEEILTVKASGTAASSERRAALQAEHDAILRNISAIAEERNQQKQTAADTQTAMSQLIAQRQQVQSALKQLEAGSTPAQQEQIDKINSEYQELESRIDAIKQANSEASKEELQNLKERYSGILQVISAYREVARQRKADASEEEKQQSLIRQSAKLLSTMQNAENSWTKAKTGSSKESYAAIRTYIRNLEELRQKLASGQITNEEFERSLSGIRTGFEQSATAIRAVGENTKTTAARIGSLSEKFATWFSITRVIMYAVRTIKDMVRASIELDSAFAQLKIVTGATDAEMSKFVDTTTQLAKNLGQSVSDVAKSVETFSRLGYSLPDASKLAEFAIIMSNVASVDISEATTGMTAIIKGFNMDVSNAEHVADVLVEVGQKYAVSAAEMMEAFEKSGAALNATNTSFEKAAGLIAAANASVQNASTVGTALKTVSARIRGSKTELEELGESVDELADGFSKYADEIKALTGFNIMVEGTTDQFKDLYDIIGGIASVWDRLSDTQQARVAEILGGTRQLQVIASIIGNWNDAVDAYETAMNSVGVATAANNIYMETAAAKINQFKATFQELASNLITSSTVSTIVDIGTGILSLVNALQKVHALLPLVIASIVIIKAHNIAKMAADSAAKVSVLSARIIAEKSVTDSLAASVASLTMAEKLKLKTEIESAVVAGTLTKEEGAQIAASIGLAGANAALATSNKGLAASFKAVTASIPVFGWIALGISVVIEAISAFSLISKSADDRIKELDAEFKELRNTIDGATSDFMSLKESADNIIPRFTELSKGVNKFGENVRLTDEEYAEFLKLNNQIAEMFPELNLGMDSNEKAMLALSYSADTLSESLYRLVDAQRQAAYATVSDTMPDVLENISETEKAYEKQIEQLKSKREEWNNVYREIISGKLPTEVGRYSTVESGAAAAMKMIEKYKRLGMHGEIVYDNQTTVNQGYVFKINWIYDGVNYDSVEKLRDAEIESIDKQIHSFENKIAAKWNSLNPVINAWVQTNFLFNDLNGEMQSIASAMISGLDFSKLGLKTKDEVTNYITENILDPLFLAGDDVKQAFESIIDWREQLRNGELSVEEFSEKVRQAFSDLFNGMDADKVNAFQNAFVNGFNAIGISGATFSDIINSLIDEWDSTSFIDIADDRIKTLDDVAKSIKAIRDEVSILDTAQKEIDKDGFVSVDTITKIKELIGETGNYLDYLYEENGVIKLNTDAWKEYILTKLSDNISGLQETRSALLAEREEIQKNRDALQYRWAHGGQSQALYDEIKATDAALVENTRLLSENGIQLGIYASQYNQVANAVDAYTEALGNFPSIKDSIENVSSAFETLANLQSTVADGFVMDLEKALEFASVYPEILNNATVTADGQIALNDEVVNSFIAAKQAELTAQVESEIQQLNAEKAVLTGRVTAAQAQIELAKSVAEGKAAITKEEAQYENDVNNALTQSFIDNGIEEATANQLANAAMAENEEEFARVAMGAFANMDENSAKAAYNMARNIYLNAQDSAISIADLAKQAHETAKAIAAMGKGEISGSSGLVFNGSGGTYGSTSGLNLYDGNFSGSNYTYQGNTISLDDYISALELDISAYNDAISQIDGQIAALEAMLHVGIDKVSSAGSGGRGSGSGSGSGGSGSGSGSGSDKSEIDNWFERQYKLHNHLLKMDAEEVEDYLVWLNDAYKRAYEEGLITLYDYYSYQEEVYNKLHDLFKDYLSDTEHEISMRSNYEYESATIIKLYKEMIEKIEKEIAAARVAGLDDTDDYIQELQQKWQQYGNAIQDIEDEITENTKSALDDLIEIRIKMIKQEIEDEKDAIKKKLDYLKDFYDKQKDMLREVYDEEKYLEEQAEKRRTIEDIQAELAQLEYDNSAWAQKRKLELAQELAEAQKDLDDFERDHALEVAQEELDALYEKQEEELNAQNELLDEKLNDARAIYEQALEDIKNGSVDLYEQMIEWNATYGDGIDQTITDAWEKAYEALDKYYDLYGKYYEGFNLENATGYTRPDDGWDNSPVSGTNPSGGGGSSGGSSGGSGSGGGSGSSGGASGGGSGSGGSSPTVSDAVKRKVAAAIWNGGYGWGTGADRSQKLKEVFGENNGIQALVNQNVGRYDIPPGKEYTYLNMRKTYRGYWTGTRNALPGMHAIDELGTETIFTSPDGNKYRMFTGGEKVLTAKASDFLYNFATSGGNILEKIIRGFTGGEIGRGIISGGHSVEVNMGDIIVRGDATKETVSEIRRVQRDAVETMLKEFGRLSRKHT